MFVINTLRTPLISSLVNPEILLTPPLLANLLIAGLVIPRILSLSTFLCLFAPPFPNPFPPLPLPDPPICFIIILYYILFLK